MNGFPVRSEGATSENLAGGKFCEEQSRRVANC